LGLNRGRGTGKRSRQKRKPEGTLWAYRSSSRSSWDLPGTDSLVPHRLLSPVKKQDDGDQRPGKVRAGPQSRRFMDWTAHPCRRETVCGGGIPAEPGVVGRPNKKRNMKGEGSGESFHRLKRRFGVTWRVVTDHSAARSSPSVRQRNLRSGNSRQFKDIVTS